MTNPSLPCLIFLMHLLSSMYLINHSDNCTTRNFIVLFRFVCLSVSQGTYVFYLKSWQNKRNSQGLVLMQ